MVCICVCVRCAWREKVLKTSLQRCSLQIFAICTFCVDSARTKYTIRQSFLTCVIVLFHFACSGFQFPRSVSQLQKHDENQQKQKNKCKKKKTRERERKMNKPSTKTKIISKRTNRMRSTHKVRQNEQKLWTSINVFLKQTKSENEILCLCCSKFETKKKQRKNHRKLFNSVY